MIREYVEALRALWAGETVDQEGQIWQLRGARLAFTPPEEIPIFIASTGPQVLGLAGRSADGVLYSGGLSLASIKKGAAFAEAKAAVNGFPRRDAVAPVMMMAPLPLCCMGPTTSRVL